MRTAITNFIVEPENSVVYKNNVEIDGKDFTMNTHLAGNDKDLLQMQGKVLNAPLYNRTSVKDGYRVHVQHNVFRPWTDQFGDMQHGNIIKDGEYFATPDLIYAYNDGKEWFSTNGWIYVTPIEYDYKSEFQGGKAIRPDKGIIAFKQDPLLEDTTLTVGDTVTFKSGRRVTTKVDGTTYLRVKSSDILLKHE